MSSFGVQQPHTFRQFRPHSRELHYLLFLPSTYAVHPQRWPLMLFLHGAGERGDDLQLVKRHGVAKIVEEQPAFPLLVVLAAVSPDRSLGAGAPPGVAR
jgi:predicted peptidase